MAIVSGATFWGGEGIINFQISYIVNGVPYLKIDGNIVRIGDWASAIYGGSTPASPGTHNVCVYDNSTGESLYCANIVVQETIAPPPLPPLPPPPTPCDILSVVFNTRIDPGYDTLPSDTVRFEINYNCEGVPYLSVDGIPTKIGDYHGYGVYQGTIVLSPGNHNICVYDPIDGSTHLCKSIYLAEPTTGSLLVQSSPSGATIYLDYINTNKLTPHTFTGLSPGIHKIGLQLAGYQAMAGDENVIAGQTVDTGIVTMPPVAAPSYGNLEVNSIPTGANISIDNINTGYVTPHTFINLLGGKHYLELSLANYQTLGQDVNITPNQTTTISIMLQLLPCTPNWQCEPGQTGYEIDGCGNRRANPACVYREAVLASCQWPL
ncbi:PEGA domain-containing protein, partial [Patescibacteria group bacterium]|nr:PEGA domain-containing protein [Patescibacteria group bacterium]